MGVVQISQAQGRVPVSIFRLQDRVNLGNFAELEETAKEALPDTDYPSLHGGETWLSYKFHKRRGASR